MCLYQPKARGSCHSQGQRHSDWYKARSLVKFILISRSTAIFSIRIFKLGSPPLPLQTHSPSAFEVKTGGHLSSLGLCVPACPRPEDRAGRCWAQPDTSLLRKEGGDRRPERGTVLRGERCVASHLVTPASAPKGDTRKYLPSQPLRTQPGLPELAVYLTRRGAQPRPEAQCFWILGPHT